MKKDVILLSMSLGAIAGSLILGLAGKIIMAILSLLVGSSTNLSLPGIFEAMIFGAVMGTVGGLLATGIKKIENLKRLNQSLVIGITLYAISILLSSLLSKIKINFFGLQFLTLIVVFGMYILYGFCITNLINRIIKKSK